MSSDWVARLARAPLVARMDADDISRRDRLQRQVDVLTTRTDAAMVASLWEGIDHRSRRIHGRDRSTLIGSNKRPFVHGTIMYRRAAFERIGGYREHTDFFEDGDLFVRFATAGRVLVLQDPLYLYRWSFGSSRFGRERDRVENAQQIGSIWGSQATPADVSVEQLEIWGRQVAAQRLNPAIFVGMAFPRVWNGRRGETLGRAISRGEFRFNRQSCAVLLWLMASALVPRLLRAVMRFRMHTRDAAAARLLQEVTAIEWPASGG